MLQPVQFFQISVPLLEIFIPIILLEIGLLILIRVLDPESTRYFIRRNKMEILTVFFAVIGYAVNYYFVHQPGYAFFINIGISFVALLVIIYLKTRERDFYSLSLKRDRDRQDWIGEGVFRYERTQKAYTITNSNSGFIFSKCLIWNDYKLNFDFKILKISLGVILRATNLSNMVMLQIFDNGIKAHIRVNGFWQFWDSKDTKLEFNNKLNLDDWYTCSMQCDKNYIRIRIFERLESTDSNNNSHDLEQIFDRTWNIPSGHISYGTQNTSLVGEIIKNTIPFPINLEYGTFGFRNYGIENALVRDVLVEKI